MVHFFSPRKLNRFLSFNRRRSKGFTLLELLVAMIIGSLIVIALLTLVVQLTETNQKDAARSQVQQDMQAATDFIAQELREAVFVYNGECLQGNGTPNPANLANTCPGIIKHIPAAMTETKGRTPVLAFWRTKKLPTAIANLCGADPNPQELNSDKAKDNLLVKAGVPCLAGNSYSLVVYAIDVKDPTGSTDIWSGNARLIRYELSQFTDGATTQANQSTGYVNPLQDPKNKFQQWPYGAGANNTFIDRQTEAESPGRPVGSRANPAVLVDFLDAKKTGDPLYDDAATTVPAPNCEEFGVDAASQTNALTPLATVTPPPPRGFYACVRGGGVTPIPTGSTVTTKAAGQNQDVLLVMKGNVTGQGGFFKGGEDRKDRISPLQTRVLIRGVVEKP